MYSPKWSQESRERFAALLPEIWELANIASGDRLSQENLGKIFGVRGSSVQDWLKGSIPGIQKLAKMASILSWSVEDLILYLKTGERPTGQSEIQKLIYKLDNLPLQDVALLVEIGAKRLASEVTGFYKTPNEPFNLPKSASSLTRLPKRATPGGV